jgi:hypothetical protein
MLAAILALCLAEAQGLGADLNQETFEAYAIGGWSPTAYWKLGPRVGNTVGAGLVSADILAADGVAGKSLRVVESGWNGRTTWTATVDKQKAPKQVFAATFRLLERVPADALARWSASVWLGPEYWDTTASVEFKDSAGTVSATLQTTEAVPIPGGSAWTLGAWLAVQLEMDYVAETVRARCGPAGGAFGEWTKPLFMKQAGQYKGVDLGYNGTVDIDTLSLQPLAAP